MAHQDSTAARGQVVQHVDSYEFGIVHDDDGCVLTVSFGSGDVRRCWPGEVRAVPDDPTLLVEMLMAHGEEPDEAIAYAEMGALGLTQQLLYRVDIDCRQDG